MELGLKKIKAIIDSLIPETKKFLSDIIAIPSLPGREEELVEYCAKVFSDIGAEVEKLPIKNDIKNDENYSYVIPDLNYEGRHNLSVVLKGCPGNRKALLLNAHLDTVPPGDGQKSPFEAGIENGVVYGRGACDDKGQIAIIYLLICLIKKTGLKLPGDLNIHLVVEEEIGGNGTLAMVRRGCKADAAIVFEATDLNICTSSRGVVWFKITCNGKAGHSGLAAGTRSALKMAVRVMEIIEEYHRDLLGKSANVSQFKGLPNPMPITFGRIASGVWPATVPNKAVLEGVMGFLPNKTRHEVMKEIRDEIENKGGSDLFNNCEIEFTLARDSSVINREHSIVQSLAEACKETGRGVELTVLTASCDAWFYNNFLDIPTVIFGAGNIKYAHSNEEQINMKDIVFAAEAVIRFFEKLSN